MICSGIAGGAFIYLGLNLHYNQKDHWAGYLVSSAALGVAAKMHLDNSNYAFLLIDGAFAVAPGLRYLSLVAPPKKMQTTRETLESQLMLGKEYAVQQQFKEAFEMYKSVSDEAQTLKYHDLVNETNAHMFTANVQKALLLMQNGERRDFKKTMNEAQVYFRRLSAKNVEKIKTLHWPALADLIREFGKWHYCENPWTKKIAENNT